MTASLGIRLGGTNSDPRPRRRRSNEFRFGARRRARLLMSNWCFSNKDSATTARTPPGRTSLAMVANRWTASMSRCFMDTDGSTTPVSHKTARAAPFVREFANSPGADTSDGKTTEWKSQALRAYQRHTLAADTLIASSYLAGTNTRRVRRALGAVFGGAVGKDTVSRVWRKVKSDWEAWNARSLTEEPIVRLILDGTVVRVRLDRQATSISLLVVLGVREDGQKVLLAIKSMGGESTEAWRAVLDDLIRRGLCRPEFLLVDGAPGLDKA